MSPGIWALWLAAVMRPSSLPSALVLAFPSGVTRPRRWQRSSSFLSQVPHLLSSLHPVRQGSLSFPELPVH